MPVFRPGVPRRRPSAHRYSQGAFASPTRRRPHRPDEPLAARPKVPGGRVARPTFPRERALADARLHDMWSRSERPS
jgi:hypothetical protein